MTLKAPSLRPANPRFSSGPCPKYPNWNLQVLEGAYLGRSHRGEGGRAKLKAAIDLTRDILGVPADYRVAIVPGSESFSKKRTRPLTSAPIAARRVCASGTDRRLRRLMS